MTYLIERGIDGCVVVGNASLLNAVTISIGFQQCIPGFPIWCHWIANAAQVDDYIVSDFYVGGFIENLGPGTEELEVRLTVNNLFDEDYASTIAPGAFWIGAPRAVAVNARLTF